MITFDSDFELQHAVASCADPPLAVTAVRQGYGQDDVIGAPPTPYQNPYGGTTPYGATPFGAPPGGGYGMMPPPGGYGYPYGGGGYPPNPYAAPAAYGTGQGYAPPPPAPAPAPDPPKKKEEEESDRIKILEAQVVALLDQAAREKEARRAEASRTAAEEGPFEAAPPGTVADASALAEESGMPKRPTQAGARAGAATAAALAGTGNALVTGAGRAADATVGAGQASGKHLHLRRDSDDLRRVATLCRRTGRFLFC